MKKRWVTLVLAIVFTFSFLSTGFADTIGNKKNQLNDVQDKIDDIKDQIDDVKGQKEDVLAEINQISSQMDKVQADINNINKQITSVKKDITETTKELEQAIKDYEKEKSLYSERLRAMYVSGPSGYLEILLSSESFSDFITNADIVKKIIDYDKNLLVEMKDKQDEIQKQKDKLEAKKKQLSGLQASLDQKKAALADQNAQKQKYYSKLKSDHAALERMLDAEYEESKNIENEIRALEQAASKSSGTYSGSKTGILRVSDIGRIPPITSPYGWRFHPILKKNKFHAGMDIGVKTGTPVYAMAEGTVLIAKYSSSYGNYVVIDHGSGLTTVYAHNSQLLVSAGQHVDKGQMISKSGSTGQSTGPHLHFEVRKNGSTVDPMPYYVVGQ